jgi:hypothetical protein
MMRYDLINRFIAERGFKSYLELGIQNPNQCFDKIICDHKVGVDPDSSAMATFIMTSDEFFASEACRDGGYDLVFVDACHLHDFVKRDAENALKCLNKNGVVIFHDCCPINEVEQLEKINSAAWCGTTWKAWVNIRRQCGFMSYTVDVDWGCGIIDASHKADIYPPIPEEDLTWEWYLKNKQWALDLTDKIK